MAQRPMSGVDVRFLGGPWDGRVAHIPENLLEGFCVPEEMDIADMLAPMTRAELLYPGAYPVIHLYRWDLTINDAGERRMRLVS